MNEQTNALFYINRRPSFHCALCDDEKQSNTYVLFSILHNYFTFARAVRAECYLFFFFVAAAQYARARACKTILTFQETFFYFILYFSIFDRLLLWPFFSL